MHSTWFLIQQFPHPHSDVTKFQWLLYENSLVNAEYWREHKKMEVHQGNWFPALWLGIIWYYMQGNSTCLSRKSTAHFVRKLSQDLSFGQGTIIRVGFLHWDRHTLKISQIAQYEPPVTIPFVLHNTVRVHFEVVHGYSFHTERQSKKTNPEMQLAWMSGSQHQFFCSTNLLEWHHNSCQHRHFFHQYPVKTSSPSKTHRYGTISVSQMFSNTTLSEAKTQLGRLN